MPVQGNWSERDGLAMWRQCTPVSFDRLKVGKKRALAAEILLPSGSLWVSTCHLDSNASPTQRSRQLAALLTELSSRGAHQLVGGDFNTTTYDASGTSELIFDLLHKLVTKGFHATVEGYMTPEDSYEQPLFATA